MIAQAMSFDGSTHSEKPFNAYFYAAIMSACAIAGVLAYVGIEEYNRIGKLEISTYQQIASIQRAYRFSNFTCAYDNYESDLFLRKITNDFVPVDKTYVPDNLAPIPARYRHPRVGVLQTRKEIIDPLTQMLQDAESAGLALRVNSAYRSHTRQKEIYDLNADVLLITKPEKAARPGYSEHQLGTAVDISQYPNNSQAGYDWLAANANRYGFVLSYPKGKEQITEFRHEPWHWRYVGTQLAQYISGNDILFNHEKSVLLPSPISESTELPYEYTGDDIWVWKTLSGGENISSIVQGSEPLDFEIDIRQIIDRFESGVITSGNTNIVMPIRDWILESNTSIYRDVHGVEWMRTTYASPREDQIVQRLEVLYRDDLGYMVISFQNQDFAERLVTEFTTNCGLIVEPELPELSVEGEIENAA